MKIALGSDHAGFEYKEAIKRWLTQHGHEVKDFGTFSDGRGPIPENFPDAASIRIRPAVVDSAAGQITD